MEKSKYIIDRFSKVLMANFMIDSSVIRLDSEDMIKTASKAVRPEDFIEWTTNGFTGTVTEWFALCESFGVDPIQTVRDTTDAFPKQN